MCIYLSTREVIRLCSSGRMLGSEPMRALFESGKPNQFFGDSLAGRALGIEPRRARFEAVAPIHIPSCQVSLDVLSSLVLKGEKQ